MADLPAGDELHLRQLPRDYVDQRFAYDFVGIKTASFTRQWRQAGRISVSANRCSLPPRERSPSPTNTRTTPSREPSSKNPREGNHIVIEHDKGEFSMLGQLKRGSIQVKVTKDQSGPADRAFGNSGNSPFPHVHYHLQTGPTWFEGEGLPIQFHNFLLNGRSEISTEPVRGDMVSSK